MYFICLERAGKVWYYNGKLYCRYLGTGQFLVHLSEYKAKTFILKKIYYVFGFGCHICCLRQKHQ